MKVKEQILIATQWIYKRVINERGGKDVDLDEFDASTCSDDRYYDIFDKEE